MLELKEKQNIDFKQLEEKVGEKVGENLTENQLIILENIANNPRLSAKKLSDIVGISSRKVEENIKKLKDLKILERVGSAKGGYWKIIESAGE